MRKRQFTAFFLALLLTVPGLVSCGKTESEEASGEQGTAPEKENGETTETTAPDILDGLDYNGATFRIRTSDTNISSNNLIEGSGELNGDSVNDAVFERNLEVSEALNVKFEYEHTNNNWDKVYESIQTLVMAGDASCDLVIDDQRGLANASIERMLYDASILSTVDFGEPCWWGDYMLNLSIDYKSIYLLAGNYFMNILDRSQALLYNRDLYRDFYGDPDELYQIVADGEWTYDQWLPLIEGAYMDLNGNAKADADDQYGMIVG
ncbi:MAG: hypothetical protein ACI4V1_08015, partial [Eubacteriales bacterium]